MSSQSKAEAADLCAPVRIARVDAIRVALPLAKPMLMAGVRIETADNVLVRIEAADGTVGWGEATSAPTMTGDAGREPDRRRSVSVTAPDRSGCPNYARLARRCLNTMHEHMRNPPLTWLCSIWSGVARAFRLSNCWADCAKPWSRCGFSAIRPSTKISPPKAKRAEGFKFFKLKVGIKPVAEEIAAVAHLRKALDPASCSAPTPIPDWSLHALQFVRDAGELGLLYLEQPVRWTILSACRRSPRSGRCRSVPTRHRRRGRSAGA